MKKVEIKSPSKIIESSIEDLSRFINKKNLLIITSPSFIKRGIVYKIKDSLNSHNTIIWSNVNPNPTIKELENAINELKEKSIEAIIALGGGSVIDSGKVLATALKHSEQVTLTDLLINPIERYNSRLPLIAIPTTSGTGSEVTPYATIWDSENHQKYSLSGSYLYPDLAFLDPTLTLSLNYENTLYPALDSISHSLESLWNTNSNFISETYAIQSLKISTHTLPLVLKDMTNKELRSLLQRASLLSGLAISQTQTAIAHSISYPLTSIYGVPHGLAVSFTLEAIIEDFLYENNYKFSNELRDIQILLKNFELKSKMKNFLSLKKALKLSNQMINPSRSKNFFKIVNKSRIEYYLKESLKR